ncbi:MAG: Dabb family protein [Pseudomonadota bacterium]
MHTHTVFFWLKDDLSQTDQKNFLTGLDLLTNEPNIRDRRIGSPAATDRDVVDSTYAYSIVLRFDDIDAHNVYQESAEHQVFVDTCFHMIQKVQVYDIDEVDGIG